MALALRVVRYLKRAYARSRILARPARHDPSLIVPFGYDPPPRDDRKVAVMIHAFHPELMGELRASCANIAAPCDLLVTTDTRAKRGVIEAALANWPLGEVAVRVVENRGRDIAPKLAAFAADYRNYDLVLFLHTKKSEHQGAGVGWREKLIAGLCGNPATVRAVFAIYDADPRMGIVFPQHHEPIRFHLHWGANFALAQGLARRLGVELRRGGTMDFVSGSMFWARPAALAPILDLGLRPADFPAEAGQTDGTLAHAVERLFLFGCELAGYRWVKVAAPDHYADRTAMIAVHSPGQLHAALASSRFEVLSSMAKQRLGRDALSGTTSDEAQEFAPRRG